jgi:hypothetical protein
MSVSGNTELANVKADIVAAIVQRELGFTAKLLPTVSDWSPLAVKGARSVRLPRFTEFAAANRASEEAGPLQAPTGAVDEITLNRNMYVSWLIDSYDLYQVSPDLQAAYIQKAAQAHARAIDLDIATTLQDGYYNTPAAFSYNALVNMWTGLLANNAKEDQMTLAVSAPMFNALIKVDEFKRADVYGVPTIPNLRPVGFIFGIPVIITNAFSALPSVGGSVGFMYDREGVGIAFQQSPNYAEQPEIEYGTKAVRAALDQVYGIEQLQQGVNGVAAGRSPLIARIGLLT